MEGVPRFHLRKKNSIKIATQELSVNNSDLRLIVGAFGNTHAHPHLTGADLEKGSLEVTSK